MFCLKLRREVQRQVTHLAGRACSQRVLLEDGTGWGPDVQRIPLVPGPSVSGGLPCPAAPSSVL